MNTLKHVLLIAAQTGGENVQGNADDTTQVLNAPSIMEEGSEPEVLATQGGDDAPKSDDSDAPHAGTRYRTEEGKLSVLGVTETEVRIQWEGGEKETLSVSDWFALGAFAYKKGKGKGAQEGTAMSEDLRATIDAETQSIWNQYAGIYELEREVEKRYESLSDSIMKIAHACSVEAAERQFTSSAGLLNLFSSAIKQAEGKIQDLCHSDEDLEKKDRFLRAGGSWKQYVSRITACITEGLDPRAYNTVRMFEAALTALKEARDKAARGEGEGTEGTEPEETVETIIARVSTAVAKGSKPVQDAFAKLANAVNAADSGKYTEDLVLILNTATVKVQNVEKEAAKRKNGNGHKAQNGNQNGARAAG